MRRGCTFIENCRKVNESIRIIFEENRFLTINKKIDVPMRPEKVIVGWKIDHANAQRNKKVDSSALAS